MKLKQKVDLTVGLLLTVFAIAILIIPLFDITNIKLVMVLTFGFYTIVNIVRFIILRKTKDYEGLHYAITSVAAMIVFLCIAPPSPKNLALILFCWIALNSLAKLKKADYYHDKRDRMYKFGLLDMAIFLITGVIACINLAYPGDVQILVVGFFLLVSGLLEIFDPITKSLIAHS